MPIRISPKQIERVLFGVAAVLIGAHVAVQTVRFLTGDDSIGGLVYFLSLGAEGNLPSYYSSLILLAAAVVSAGAGLLAAVEGLVTRPYWYGLGGIFVFLALDEILAIHERLIGPVRSLFGTSGFLYYAWVIPYGFFTLLVAVIYLRFLMRLPARTSRLIVLAGAMYVFGALVLEMLGGWLSERSGNGNVLYVTVQSVEEILELAGVLLFVHAVLDYLSRKVGGVLLEVAVETTDEASPESPGAGAPT
ncbi:MAG: hypothetical protein R3304_04875 [Longimicrobiales bacterium]|nr:hypothetical protein [Longimicrobiales bacterium]